MTRVVISVITVCFNAASTIEKTIRSVCSQVDADFEFIIIDGASTDGTLSVIGNYADRISMLISEKDAGIYDAMNKGIARATGDVLYFLNADDSFVDEHVLRDVARAFELDLGRTVVYGDVIVEDAPGGFFFQPAKAFKRHSYTELLHNSFCHQAFFARRSLFVELGAYDTRYKYAADYDWMIRAFKFRRQGFYFFDRRIAHYFYLGRSRQYDAVTRAEKHDIQRRHLQSLEYAWYYFRYVLVRGIKKRMLNETA